MTNPTQLDPSAGFACPLPLQEHETVLLAHGGGGRLTQRLIEELLVPAFDSAELRLLHDGALLDPPAGRLAFSTDSFVVSPLFFPGGDIGSLAVHGTVNDLAMCGATPRWLSVSLILEEGLPLATLRRVVESLAQAARAVPVTIVTGDTKVVGRGQADGLFINTAGIGVVRAGVEIGPQRARAGDVVLLSGPIARHGMAIMSQRESLGFESALRSDSAALHGLVARLLDRAPQALHVLRDPTRGGVASALNEIAAAAAVGVRLEEAAIPVPDEARSACELLGLDPLYVANEGVCLAIVAPEAAEELLEAMRADPCGRDAVAIGRVTTEHPGRVVLRTLIGGTRVVDVLSGEQLPRIC